MTAHVTVICGNKCCKKPFEARAADVARGWGKFCSKSCKAKKQGRLPASKETRAMWREFNREMSTLNRHQTRSQVDEYDAIMDDLGETDDDKWGDSGLHSY